MRSDSGWKSSALALAALTWLAGCRTAPVKPASTVPTTPPRLAATRFVAYGDNITEGFVQRCPGTTAASSSSRIGFFLAQGRAQPSPTAYPAQLQEMLEQRYPAQTITVINEGSGGEDVQAGVTNLPRVLTTDMPQVLLLQEGINTLNTSHAEGIPLVVDGLRTMIQEARSRSITVLAGTLLPERPGGCRAYDFDQDHDDIIAANVQIRRMIGLEGAILVDLYEAFNGHTARLIGEDGLHPNAEGYVKIAETFFDSIRKYLES